MIRRALAAIVAAAFLLSGLVAINMQMAHGMDMGCSISSPNQPAAGCGMGVSEHLTWWHSTFSGIPGSGVLLLAVTLFISAFAMPKKRLLARAHGSKAPPGRLCDYFAIFIAAGKAQPLLYA